MHEGSFEAKLVRDGIPDVIRAQGETPITRTVSGAWLAAWLIQKGDEEMTEVARLLLSNHKDTSAITKELADMQQVLDDLAYVVGASPEQVRYVQEQKARKLGGFGAGIILQRVTSQTIETYDGSAEDLADYFRGIGPRVNDIEIGLRLANSFEGDATVLEIGCGDGRDAAEIMKRSKKYTGIDNSKGMLAIATRDLPQDNFIHCGAVEYDYPNWYDVVYAFASLLHLTQDQLAIVAQKVHGSLKAGGIFYISLKTAQGDYEETIKEDQFGVRKFCLYSPEKVIELAGDGFEVAYSDTQRVNDTDWFTLALKKRPM